MSRNLKKYVTPLLAAAAATVAIAAALRLSQQITSPATGVARDPSANLPATLSSRLLRRTFSSTPSETSPGCSSTTEQVRGTGTTSSSLPSAARTWRRWSRSSWLIVLSR